MLAGIAWFMELKLKLTLNPLSEITDFFAMIISLVPLHDLNKYTLIGLGGHSDYDYLITTLTHFPSQQTFYDLWAKLFFRNQCFHALSVSTSHQHQAFLASSSSTLATFSLSSTNQQQQANGNHNQNSNNGVCGGHNNHNWGCNFNDKGHEANHTNNNNNNASMQT